jgi:glycosyltransferase involved in cell wall biosynthesis
MSLQDPTDATATAASQFAETGAMGSAQVLSLIEANRLFEAQQALIALRQQKIDIEPLIGMLGAQQQRLQEQLRMLQQSVTAGALDDLGPLLDLLRYNRLFTDAQWQAWILTTAVTFVCAVGKDKEKSKILSFFLNRLGFHKDADKIHVHLCFEAFCQPLMLRLLEQNQWELALQFEKYTYIHYIKRFESEAHFSQCFSSWTPAMIEAGRAAALRHPIATTDAQKASRKIALVMLDACLLAHVEVLLNMLHGYQQLDQKPFEFSLYVISGHHTAMHARFSELGIPVVYLDDTMPQASLLDKLIGMKQSFVTQAIGTVAWLSLAPLLAFAFAMRLAPRQVWWAMKYHALKLEECDLHLTSLIPEAKRVLGGTVWHGAFYSRDYWFFPEHTQAAQNERARLGDYKVVLGTFGREEKIDKPEFLDTVADILQAHPDTCYLWTGRTESASIKAHFNRRGVLPQTFFIGWVNTTVYAQVIDVFLDSFPFGCGYTLLETMAAGKPAVFHLMDDPEHLTNLYTMIAPLQTATGEDGDRFRGIFGENGFLVASNRAEYVQIAESLITDPEHRREAGEKYRRFVEAFVSDNRHTARQFIQHLTDNLSWPSSPSC